MPPRGVKGILKSAWETLRNARKRPADTTLTAAS